MHKRFLAGFLAAGFLLAPVLFAADEPKKKDSKESDEVAQAIAFERYKDAAAARQARIEAKHPTVTDSNSDADRNADQSKSKRDNDQQKKEQHRK